MSRLRVAQWTTGIVGGSALRAIVAHPDLELVGCHAHSPDKIGRDAGALCGIEPIGVRATGDIADIVALRPDCVVYMPQWPDVDELVALLEAGINVVSTARFVTLGHTEPGAAQRVDAAAKRGDASIYGTGMNPAWVNALALVAAGFCARVDRISVLESVDCSFYASEGNWTAFGFGRPVDDPALAEDLRRCQPEYREAMDAMAAALGVTLDAIELDVEFAAAIRDIDLGYMQIPAGGVAGLREHWVGTYDHAPLIELRMVWKLGRTVEPDWPLLNGYEIEIDGDPSLRCRFRHRPDVSDGDFDIGVSTAMPAVNAIQPVCAARPGILTIADLPLVTARHLVRARRGP